VSSQRCRDTHDAIIGYLLIGTDNSARKQFELELHNAMAVAEKANPGENGFPVQHEP